MSKVIKGNILLDNLYLDKIPDIFQDVEVLGNFFCDYNQLTSLKGAPKYVGYYFYCSYNRLTSLEGAPEYVGGKFDCRYNRLTSLKGAPKYVSGDFLCYYNAVKFTEEQVRKVCQVKGDVYV